MNNFFTKHPDFPCFSAFSAKWELKRPNGRNGFFTKNLPGISTKLSPDAVFGFHFSTGQFPFSTGFYILYNRWKKYTFSTFSTGLSPFPRGGKGKFSPGPGSKAPKNPIKPPFSTVPEKSFPQSPGEKDEKLPQAYQHKILWSGPKHSPFPPKTPGEKCMKRGTFFPRFRQNQRKQ